MEGRGACGLSQKALGLISEQDEKGRYRGNGCLLHTTENLDKIENDMPVSMCVCAPVHIPMYIWLSCSYFKRTCVR